MTTGSLSLDAAGPSREAARRQYFDQLAAHRARDARRHRTYYRDRDRWLRQLIRPEMSVIEVGCGTGLALAPLPNMKKVGLDFSPEMIQCARKADPLTDYRVDDAERLEHQGTYDYVLLLDTINYLSDVQAALEQIHARLCHNRTRLVITHYNFLWQPLFWLGETLGYKTRFPEQNWLSRADIVNLLDLTGFEPVQTGGRVLLPVGIPLIEPFCNRVLASLPLFRSLCLVKTIIARPRPTGRASKTVTVLSAVRNERGNIEPIAKAMPKMGLRTELLFVEGHSSDGTWEEIERVSALSWPGLTVRGIKQPGRGKADALHCGAAASAGDIIVIYDGDFTVHPSELPKLIDVLETGKGEMVNASRLVYPLEQGAMRFLNLLGNKTFSLIFSWLFSQKLVDTLSPVKAFFRADYRRMDSRMDPFGDFDFFLGAAEQQLKMREVPVRYLERTYGVTKIRRFHHAWLLMRMFFHGARKLKWR